MPPVFPSGKRGYSALLPGRLYVKPTLRRLRTSKKDRPRSWLRSLSSCAVTLSNKPANTVSPSSSDFAQTKLARKLKPLDSRFSALSCKELYDEFEMCCCCVSLPSSGHVRRDCRSPGRGGKFSPISACSGVLKVRDLPRCVPLEPT